MTENRFWYLILIDKDRNTGVIREGFIISSWTDVNEIKLYEL